jgi:hypothetical protein
VNGLSLVSGWLRRIAHQDEAAPPVGLCTQQQLDPRPQLEALDRGEEFDLAGGEPPQYNAWDGEGNRAPDVALGVIGTGSTVEHEEALSLTAQLPREPLAAHQALPRYLAHISLMLVLWC